MIEVKENYFPQNLKTLILFYKETQKDLARLLSYSDQLISDWVCGKKHPNDETVKRIADHYFVSVEDLMHKDLSRIYTKDILSAIDGLEMKGYLIEMFPTVKDDIALSDDQFRKVYEDHMMTLDIVLEVLCLIKCDAGEERIEEEINRIKGVEDISDIFFGYLNALENEKTQYCAAANMLSIWCLFRYIMISMELLKNNNVALGTQISKKYGIQNNTLDDSEFYNGIVLFNEELMGKKALSKVKYMLSLLKRTDSYGDIADYYCAMQYIINGKNNGESIVFNSKLGLELMNTFAEFGNIYAKKYLSLIQYE